MDAVSIFTALIVMGVFMLIFILPTIGTKRNQKKMHAKLNGLAREHNATITYSTILGDVIIGLDEQHEIVFYFKLVKEIENSNVIFLKEMKNCKMLNQTKSLKSKNENYNQFEKLGLRFVPKDKTKPDTVWEFYNIEETSHLNFDLKLLEQLGMKLNARLLPLQTV